MITYDDHDLKGYQKSLCSRKYFDKYRGKEIPDDVEKHVSVDLFEAMVICALDQIYEKLEDLCKKEN